MCATEDSKYASTLETTCAHIQGKSPSGVPNVDFLLAGSIRLKFIPANTQERGLTHAESVAKSSSIRVTGNVTWSNITWITRLNNGKKYHVTEIMLKLVCNVLILITVF